MKEVLKATMIPRIAQEQKPANNVGLLIVHAVEVARTTPYCELELFRFYPSARPTYSSRPTYSPLFIMFNYS